MLMPLSFWILKYTDLNKLTSVLWYFLVALKSKDSLTTLAAKNVSQTSYSNLRRRFFCEVLNSFGQKSSNEKFHYASIFFLQINWFFTIVTCKKMWSLTHIYFLWNTTYFTCLRKKVVLTYILQNKKNEMAEPMPRSWSLTHQMQLAACISEFDR